ncbi:DUF3667 domain-containing protein [Mucilaginibacter mali]|uniref:DUF3667 domain-containing protein n=1 Tax=Mucilaginibacter mali TaxID=2740462 RepID=A0A7D4QVG1_9SPHI|nr:DUF3667 domain-containing protein [Mucilaginibacter mali]QKJ31649.1 DUF3667 domain-containing protein [Mucilaginibacter mali]
MECKTCGNSHPEKFCPSCGEKSFDPKQLSLKEFAEELFEGFMHFDNKFFRTVKMLITKPGQLSLEYTHGRRVYFMRPIQFFLVVNLLFFVLAFHNMYSLSLYNYITFTPFTNYNTKQIIGGLLAEKHLTLAEYTQLFNEKIKVLSKEMIFLFIPLYGGIFALFFFKKKQYFVEHLTFATHFCAFILLLALASFYFVTLPFYAITRISYSADFDNISSLLTTACVGIYAAVAINRFYKPHLIWSIVVALLIAGSFFSFIQFYRMILFFQIVRFGH